MATVEKKKAVKVEKNSTSESKSSSSKKTKSKEKGDRFDDQAKGKATVDILDEAAMENAYNICHNVQDLLRFRGFKWPGADAMKKKKGKKRMD